MGILGLWAPDDLTEDIQNKVWIQICQWKNVIFSMDSMANSIFADDVRILNLELYIKMFYINILESNVYKKNFNPNNK